VRTLFTESGRIMGISAIFALSLVGWLCLGSPSAWASVSTPLVPIVRGAPPAANANVVALCPDLTERAEVFLARGEHSLADRLARSGYRVYLVDPWSSTLAASGGFDAVVSTVYPEIVADLQRAAGAGRVTWIGHGLCGFLPIAAAAGGGGPTTSVDWVGLGTRLDWSQPSPLLTSWLRSWERGDPPVPRHSQHILFTGLREAVGPRGSSVPPGLDGGKSTTAAVQLEAIVRSGIGRPPVLAVLKDLIRWFERGAAGASTGWLDYGIGKDHVLGRGLFLMPASDPLAPPESTLQPPSAFPSTSGVEFVLLARSEGAAEDYGHLGLLLSRNASADGDRLILRWLRGHRDRP
jgi:hypothetical protein